jgi:hypothetical protein
MNTEAPRSSWWLALRVLDEPRQVFQELAARPRALAPIILLLIVAAIVAVGTPGEALEATARVQAEALGGRLDADAQQEMIERAASPLNRVFIFAGWSVFGVVTLAVVALVLMLIFGATASEPLKFKDEFAIVTHAFVPQLAGGLLAVILMVAAGMHEFANPATNPLSLGFLISRDTSPFLHRFANGITLFGAWNVFLLALGNQVKARAASITGPLAIVGGLWLLLKVGFAAVGGVFGG